MLPNKVETVKILSSQPPNLNLCGETVRSQYLITSYWNKSQDLVPETIMDQKLSIPSMFWFVGCQ